MQTWTEALEGVVPQADAGSDAETQMLPMTSSGVCDAGTVDLNTQGHRALGHESNLNFKVSKATSAQLDFYWANETSLSIRSATDAVILEGFRSYTVFQGTKYFVKVRALSFGTVCFCPLA